MTESADIKQGILVHNMPCFRSIHIANDEYARSYFAMNEQVIKRVVGRCKHRIISWHAEGKRGAVIYYPQKALFPAVVSREQLGVFDGYETCIGVIEKYNPAYMIPVILRYETKTVIMVIGQPWMNSETIEILATADKMS